MAYTFNQIKAALASEDPEGLLARGVPADEYDCEASLIEGQIAREAGDALIADRVAKIVAEIGDVQFGPFDPQDLQKRRPAFSPVARKIVTFP
jgi:hypothetical protein